MASPPCPSPPQLPGSPGHPPLTSGWQPHWAPSPPPLLSWSPVPCSFRGWGCGSRPGPTVQTSPPWPLARPSTGPIVAPRGTRQPHPKQGSQLSSADRQVGGHGLCPLPPYLSQDHPRGRCFCTTAVREEDSGPVGRAQSSSYHGGLGKLPPRGTGRSVWAPPRDIQDKQLSQNSRNKEAGLPRT